MTSRKGPPMRDVHPHAVADIWENYLPVYPESRRWEDTRALLLLDPIDRAVLDELMDQHRRLGKFREPVTLVESSEDGEPAFLADGTHRVVAAQLLGLTHIDAGWEKAFDPDAGIPVTHITFHRRPSEEMQDTLMNLLRSVPVNDLAWFTCSISSLGPGGMSLYWGEDSLGEHIPALETRLWELLEATEPGLMAGVSTEMEYLD